MGRDYDNTNRGALFKNNRREKDTQPDLTGTINVGGTEYRLSAWARNGARGEYLSLSVSPKDSRAGGGAGGARGGAPGRAGTRSAPRAATPAAASGPSSDDFVDDDFPFVTQWSAW